MFGRNWKEPSDYKKIAEYPPLRQAWEFLRRKPSYQLDCMVALEIRSWINGLPGGETFIKRAEGIYFSSSPLMRVLLSAEKYYLPGEDLAKIMQHWAGHSVKITPEVKKAVEKLTTAEVNLLFANSGQWLAPRHNLSGFPREVPVMPTENEPEGLDLLFKHSTGGNIITSLGVDFSVPVPAHHAAIIIDLEQPIKDQLEGIAKKVKRLQPAEKKCKPYKLLPKYIRLLDALEEKGTEFPLNRDLYPLFIEPEKNNKTSPDQYISDLRQTANRLRDKDYNILARRGQVNYWTEFAGLFKVSERI